LRARGLWDAVVPRLLYGENVAQAAQYASSGDADGAIVAWSLVVAPPLRDRGSASLLPESLHEPLRQRMVLLKPATAAAERLYDHLRSPAARAVLERNGFTLPGD
jgi:molybdate transport system substrate-binding protein